MTIAFERREEQQRRILVSRVADEARELSTTERPLGLSASGRFVVSAASGCDLSIHPTDGGPTQRSTLAPMRLPCDWRGGQAPVVVAITSDDHALLAWTQGASVELESRSLVSGKTRWFRQFQGWNAGVWGPDHAAFEHEALIDRGGTRLAVRDHERWTLGSLVTGETPRSLEVGPHTTATWFGDGAFAVARGDAVWVWNQAHADAGSVDVALDGDYALAVAGDGLLRRRGPAGVAEVLSCPNDRPLRPSRGPLLSSHESAEPPRIDLFAVNGRGRAVWAGAEGWACVGELGHEPVRIDVLPNATHLIVAAKGDAFTLADDEGNIELWPSLDATPRRWSLGVEVRQLTTDPEGRILIASLSDRVMLLPAEGGAAQELIRTDGLSADAAIRPAGGEVAIQVGSGDHLLRIDTATGARRQTPIPAPQRPAVAYAPSGGRLALAADSGLVVVEGERHRAIDLAAAAVRVAWIDDEHLAVIDARGDLSLVDTLLADSVTVTRTGSHPPLALHGGDLIVAGEAHLRLPLEWPPAELAGLRSWFDGRTSHRDEPRR